MILRRFTAADVGALAALHGDAAVMRHIDDGAPVPRAVVEWETLPAILREYDELPAGLGLRHVDTFFADWPDPLPGAEHGDVVYAVTRREWLA